MRPPKIDVADVAVYVERDEINPIYDELVSRAAKDAVDYPFATKKDLFILSACIGAHQNRFHELEGNTIQIFDSATFNRDTDVPLLAALAFHRTKTLETLFDPRQIVNIAQGWANGGIHVVYQQLVAGSAGRPLYNLVDMVASQFSSRGERM